MSPRAVLCSRGLSLLRACEGCNRNPKEQSHMLKRTLQSEIEQKSKGFFISDMMWDGTFFPSLGFFSVSRGPFCFIKTQENM